MHTFRLFLRSAVTAAAALLVLSAHAADLQAYTEDWPPYNFEENGTVRGISTDVLRAACGLAKLTCSVELVPWARAYKTAQTQPGTLAFTTARKPSREQEFAWVGPILPRATWIYVRANLAQTTPLDLSTLRFGVVRGEAATQDLLDRGVPPANLLEHATNMDVIRLLQSGSIDAMVDTEVSMLWSLRKMGLGANTVRKSLKLTDEGAYYFALNPATDSRTVQRLQSALDKLHSSGRVNRVVRGYTAEP